MAYKLNINMVDGLGKTINRSFGLAADADQATDATNAGGILDLYAAMTDCGVLGGTVTSSLKFAPTGNTPTAPAGTARYWQVARISVSLTPAGDGTQTVGTFELPAPKAAITSGGSVVDDGSIGAFLTEFLSSGKGRMADGQYANSTTIIGGYVYNKPHPESEA